MVRGYEHVGQLYKKRGGLGRHAKTPWVARTFALGYDGVLSYFDTDHLITARGTLNLPRAEAVLSVVGSDPSDDAPTKYMMIITHIQGQRWKLCANSQREVDEWQDALAKFCRSRPVTAARTAPPVTAQRPKPPSATVSEDVSSGSSSQRRGPTSTTNADPSSTTSVQDDDAVAASAATVAAAATLSADNDAALAAAKKPLPPSSSDLNDAAPVVVAPIPQRPPQQPQQARGPAMGRVSSKRHLAGGRHVAASSKDFALTTLRSTRAWVRVASALIAVDVGALIIFMTDFAPFTACAVMVLVNAHIALVIARCLDEAPPPSETMVSLIVPPVRLPAFLREDDGLPKARKPEVVASSGAAVIPQEAVLSSTPPGEVSLEERAALTAAMTETSPAGGTQKLALGSTGLRRVPFDAEGGPPGTWSRAPAWSFRVRQLGYAKSKRKAPSLDSFYDVVAVDLFDTESRVNGVCDLMAVEQALSTSEKDVAGVPSVFVVNAQIPSETGPYRVKPETADGHGYQVVVVMKLSDQARSDLKTLGASSSDNNHENDGDERSRTTNGNNNARHNALRLLQRYCELAPKEPSDRSGKERGRFKVIAQLRNIDEVSIPNFAKSYNGKPALINKTGLLTRPAPGILEMDVNVHGFGYVARVGLQSIYRDFQDFILSIAFVIEGRNDDELPECLLSAFDLNHANWTMASPL